MAMTCTTSRQFLLLEFEKQNTKQSFFLLEKNYIRNIQYNVSTLLFTFQGFTSIETEADGSLHRNVLDQSGSHGSERMDPRLEQVENVHEHVKDRGLPDNKCRIRYRVHLVNCWD